MRMCGVSTRMLLCWKLALCRGSLQTSLKASLPERKTGHVWLQQVCWLKHIWDTIVVCSVTLCLLLRYCLLRTFCTDRKSSTWISVLLKPAHTDITYSHWSLWWTRNMSTFDPTWMALVFMINVLFMLVCMLNSGFFLVFFFLSFWFGFF